MTYRTSRLHALRAAACIVVSVFTVSVQAQMPTVSTGKWGNYERLFAVDSPWNSRPVKPVLGTYQIKKPIYNPTWLPSIDDGAYSLTVFKAVRTDPPMTVYGRNGAAGVNDPDSGQVRNITIPHWPASVAAAIGTDGHADIVDSDTGIVHSFFQLKNVSGKWTASMYSWSAANGRGWGEPTHWSQGARASGVPSSGGLIRRHELTDGKPLYEHALAMSLPSQTLGNGVTTPSYVYPATTADASASANTGAIPLGGLMMLPASFNSAGIVNPELRKVAETLKTYGAYVVDRNYDTAYSIYVENGANFSLMKTWDARVIADLENIRAALRQVVGVESWLDGDGNKRQTPAQPELLSMRGIWQLPLGGLSGGVFDTWRQSVVFPATAKKISAVNYTSLSKVSWSVPAGGTAMRFLAATTGGATMRLQVMVAGVVTVDSGNMFNGVWHDFTWPKAAANTVTVKLWAESGVNTASTARGILTRK